MDSLKKMVNGDNQQLDMWQYEQSQALQALHDTLPPRDQALIQGRREEIARLWVFSEFARTSCRRNPLILLDLLHSGDLDRRYPDDYYMTASRQAAVEGPHQGDLAAALRWLRMREMVRLSWRELLGVAPVMETCREVSLLAEALLTVAVEMLNKELSARFGAPMDQAGRHQGLVVLGMGKLGARELNFSSDIDLIFAYPENGKTALKGLSNQEYFMRLGQRLIKLISDRTALGFLFRVDMRLRPHGNSGPLVSSFAAMEDYYQLQGRSWERYAMIKARPVAGDLRQGDVLMAMLKPFVYRRYLDFNAFQSLRDMKQLLVAQVKRKGMQDNIKLGSGGIREVEFIGQTFQMIRAGREPGLQRRDILGVLRQLEKSGHLPAYAVNDLTQAYLFLRKVENCLQAYADQQTHNLPKDEQGQVRLAAVLGYKNWRDLLHDLDFHRRRVGEQFEQVFASPQTETWDDNQLQWKQVWLDLPGAQLSQQVPQQLSQAGFEGDECLRLLQAVQQAAFFRHLPATGRQRFDQLIPLLLGATARCDHPTQALQRSLVIIQSIALRTSYLALLVENPVALSQLVKLSAASPWIAEILAKYPLLLDELLDPRRLYAPLAHTDLVDELQEMTLHFPADDLENRMEVLRQFQHMNVLRVAAADITGVLPLMRVSDYLTSIAEVVLEQALVTASQYMLGKHGEACYCLSGESRTAQFVIVAYGKLGGLELGYGSDLDLVFIHDSRGEQQQSNGAKPLDNNTYFARLAQRLVHILTTRTPSGVLYDVDVRLRPDGASGMLVSSLDSFCHYQQQRAWTWEHQALVRARPVAGDERLGKAFERVRLEVLSQPRDTEQLRLDVVDMRRRMHASTAKVGRFHLKSSPGGMIDVEFIVQYLVLRNASRQPRLCRWTDNIRNLEALGELGLLSPVDAELLEQAYKTYRERVHRLNLQAESVELPASSYRHLRDGVESIWHKTLETV